MMRILLGQLANNGDCLYATILARQLRSLARMSVGSAEAVSYALGTISSTNAIQFYRTRLVPLK